MKTKMIEILTDIRIGVRVVMITLKWEEMMCDVFLLDIEETSFMM